MSRTVPLRLTVGLVLFPIAALLSAECGGNDTIDSPDSSSDAANDGTTSDAVSDRGLVDRTNDTSPQDSAIPDGPTADAAIDADAASRDSSTPRDAGDAGARGDAAEAGDAEAGNLVDASDAQVRLDSGTLVAPPVLGTAKTFAVLASAAVSNTGGTTTIVGDVGSGLAVTGLTGAQVTGTIHVADGPVATAEADLTIAYNDLAARPCLSTMTGMDLGGQTLAPGVYCYSTSAGQTGTLTLDGQGNPNAVWIFQIGSTLTVATNSATVMTNQGNACNVYWQVGSSATINGGAQVKGNILAQASISLLTSATLSPGRALARTAAVSLLSNSISNAGCP